MKRRLEARIHGRVQMVMFRDFTCRNARRLGLVGYVRNEDDGSVIAIAEGEEEKLNNLLKLLHKGPILAHVEGVDETWKETTDEFSEFTILYE